MKAGRRHNTLIISALSIMIGALILIVLGVAIHDQQQQKVLASLDIHFSARTKVAYGADLTSADLVNKITPGARLIKATKLDTKKIGIQKLTFTITKAGVEKRIVHQVKIAKPVPTKKKVTPYQYPAASQVKPSYYQGILLVNKTHPLPEDYGGIQVEAEQALLKLQAGAQAAGFTLPQLSGYRSYQRQQQLYQSYVNKDGVAAADHYSSRPGFSEHQTGLAFDVGAVDDHYGETAAGQWLANHCADYGFIIRFPQGKEAETGYQYEPWHIRFVGSTVAKTIMAKKLSLEAYLDQVDVLTTP
ncbi:M15 family metallopeptidase [Lapidilactobacillus luobeiensis]|uniref:M15 family metallopeptidase n=1 Tax=Lapidilactobacillus luobeiensis TaxID=2950371 RepID=UPI0021C2D133|nr:M15 family metallopeptidase [Lapidilactobacillus luobeiensis]